MSSEIYSSRLFPQLKGKIEGSFNNIKIKGKEDDAFLDCVMLSCFFLCKAFNQLYGKVHPSTKWFALISQMNGNRQVDELGKNE